MSADERSECSGNESHALHNRDSQGSISASNKLATLHYITFTALYYKTLTYLYTL